MSKSQSNVTSLPLGRDGHRQHARRAMKDGDWRKAEGLLAKVLAEGPADGVTLYGGILPGRP